MANQLTEFMNQELTRRRMSMRELARQAGISHALVSEVINGNVTPSANFCIKIAPALHIDGARVLRLAGHLPGEDSDDPDPLRSRIMEVFTLLNEENQERALQFLEMMVDSQRLRGRKSASVADKAPT